MQVRAGVEAASREELVERPWAEVVDFDCQTAKMRAGGIQAGVLRWRFVWKFAHWRFPRLRVAA